MDLEVFHRLAELLFLSFFSSDFFFSLFLAEVFRDKEKKEGFAKG
jgi:hypothetical protein